MFSFSLLPLTALTDLGTRITDLRVITSERVLRKIYAVRKPSQEEEEEEVEEKLYTYSSSTEFGLVQDCSRRNRENLYALLPFLRIVPSVALV